MPDLHYTLLRLAELYDRDSPWGLDTEFYISFAGSTAAKVLDVGCGTGTLCLGLAQAGHSVTGVDPAAAMLSVASSKQGASQVEWVEATAQSYTLDNRFDRITMTGHAFQCLLTDEAVSSALSNMRRHARDGAMIAFESRNPGLDWEKRWRRSSVWNLPDGKVYQSRSDLSVDAQLVTFDHSYRFRDETLVSASTLRFMTRIEIEAHLEASGFVITSLYGDWDARPFDEATSKEMIFVATAAD